MTITDKYGDTKYKSFKASVDPEGWNWYENRNGNWSLTGFSLLLNGHIDTVVFTAIGKRGKALRGGFAIALDAFVDVTVRLLAYLWDLPEESIRNVAAQSERVKRQAACIAAIEAALPDGGNTWDEDVAAAFALLDEGDNPEPCLHPASYSEPGIWVCSNCNQRIEAPNWWLETIRQTEVSHG